jgi:hypothetical protein
MVATRLGVAEVPEKLECPGEYSDHKNLNGKREGKPGAAMIFPILIDTATKTRPVRVAAAPACTARSVCHSASGGIWIEILAWLFE